MNERPLTLLTCACLGISSGLSAQSLLHDLPVSGPVELLTDLDGDGSGEFAIGRVVYSGADASVLLDTSALGVASAVQGIDDLDGDGRQDLVFGDFTT